MNVSTWRKASAGRDYYCSLPYEVTDLRNGQSYGVILGLVLYPSGHMDIDEAMAQGYIAPIATLYDEQGNAWAVDTHYIAHSPDGFRKVNALAALSQAVGGYHRDLALELGVSGAEGVWPLVGENIPALYPSTEGDLQ